MDSPDGGGACFGVINIGHALHQAVDILRVDRTSVLDDDIVGDLLVVVVNEPAVGTAG